MSPDKRDRPSGDAAPRQQAIVVKDAIEKHPEVKKLPERGWDRGFDGHRRRQATRGLRLTYAQRLEWLGSAMQAFRSLQGRARHEG